MDYLSRGDPLSSYLDSPSNSEEVMQNSLMQSATQIANTLISWGLPTPGDLFSNDTKQVGKTVNCLHQLLQQRQRDLALRNEMHEKIHRIDQERANLTQTLERTVNTKNGMEAEVTRLTNLLRNNSGKWKAEREKLMNEKEEFRRECNRMQHKEAQYQHELKKKDNSYAKLQEQLRKTLGEKEMPVKNSLELTEPLHSKGVTLFSRGGDAEFSYMISRGYEENQNRLLAENHDLRTAFELLQKELFAIMNQRRDAFMKRYEAEHGTKGPDFSEFDLGEIRLDALRMPFDDVHDDVLSVFQENLRKFREFLGKSASIYSIDGVEEIDENSEFGQVKSLNELKKLLNNYKILIQNQENLIQKSVLGSRSKASDAITITASRLKAATDREIDQANKFLQEEFANLEVKQREIENDRKAISDTSQQLDQEKVHIARQREQLQDERARWEQAIMGAVKLNADLVDDLSYD